MNCGRFLQVGAGCAFLVVVSCVLAQDSGSLSFTIRFADGKTTYSVGERIPIELALASSSPGVYWMNTQSSDSSGRVELDHFHVTPGGRDPLQRYREGGFIGGGVGSIADLTSSPQTQREDLNDWVALDKPGYYTVSLTTDRVGRRAAKLNELIHLDSNTLEFEVVAADPAWLRATTSEAVAVLDDPKSGVSERQVAVRTLRFLDTPGSVEALVRELGRADAGC